MREHKYRIWLEPEQRMRYDVPSRPRDYLYFTQPCKKYLMQYTGLLDKNGKEGAHRDIVRMSIFLYTIEWCDKSAKFYLKSINGIDNMKYSMTHFTKNGVIEGNFFENNELMREKI